MPGVKVIHMSQEEIERTVNEKKPWENVKNVPGVKKAHCMVCESDDCVKLYTNALETGAVATINYGTSVSESEAEEDVEPVQHESLKVGDWVVGCV